MGHFACSDGAALTEGLAFLGHLFLVVPAHAEHDVGVFGEVYDGVAGLGVAGEDDGLAAFDVEAVGEGVEVGLDVFGWCRCDLPFVGGADGAGSDVTGIDDGRFAREGAAAVLVYGLGEGMVYAGDPVVSEDAFLFVEDAVGDALGEGGSVDAEGVFLADGLVPAAEEEAWVVDVVVEVVVGEEEVVDLGREEAGLDEFVGSSGPAVEHDLFAVDVGDVCGAEAGGGWSGGAGADDVEGGGGGFGIGHGGSLGGFIGL